MKDGQANYVDYEIILYSKPACQSNQVGTHAVFVINDEFHRCALRYDRRFASLRPVIRRILQIFLFLKIVTIARNSDRNRLHRKKIRCFQKAFKLGHLLTI